MTNLSELLPSGGGAKEFSAVASGTLTSGQVVALKTDGKVEAVALSSASLGTAVSPFGGNQGPTLCKLTDTTFLLTGRDSTNSYNATTAIGTVSNGSISFGTNAAISAVGPTSEYLQAFPLTDNKFVILWRDFTNSNRPDAIVGEVSGGSITYGSGVTFETGQTTLSIAQAGVALTASKFVIVYEDASNTSYGTAIVGDVSGNTITFGTAYVYQTSNSTKSSVVARLNDSKIVLAYSETPNSSRGRVQVLTISGTTFTPGNAINFDSSSVLHFSIVAMSETQFVVSYIDGGSSNYGKSIVGSVSGTTITMGSTTEYNSSSTKLYAPNSVKINDTQFAVAYSPVSPSTDRNVRIGTITAGTITFASAVTFSTGTDSNSVSGITLIGTSDLLLGSDPNATEFPVVDYKLASTNVSSFIGITSEAIANTATGKVNPQGGVATSSSPSSGEAGTAVVFTGNIASTDAVAVFDSSSNQVVIGFQNASTGGGQAIVADITASTNAVTLGSAGSYQSAGGASYNAITYDASANKIVSICSALASPFQGVAYVGTVSGTSISYTGAVNFNGTENYQGGDLTYDSSNNVTVASFERNDAGNNKHGAAVVGTISGGAITFGTASDFAPSTNIQYANNTFDSNSNKVVTVFQNSSTGYGNAVVGTVSGTTISHGSLSVLTTNGVEMGTGGTICFDSTNNKVIAPYRNTTDSKGYVRIGTVSGTAITFGNAVEFDSAPGGQSIRSVYDSNLNKVIIFYTDSSNYPTVRTGTVSGTSIVLDDAFTVATTTVTTDMSCAAAFDSSENRTLLSYKPSATGLGNAQVYLTAGTAQDLIVGSTYYVQNNGNLTTTSSTVTAGKAISTTQLVLKGAS